MDITDPYLHDLIGIALPKRQVLDPSKLKEFAEDNCTFDENDKAREEKRKHCGKRRNCSLRVFSPFPTVFLNDLSRRHIKPGLIWERINTP